MMHFAASVVGVGKDLAHFLCFIEADSFGSAVYSAFLNTTAVALLSTDGCGCSKSEGWSLEEERCTAAAVAHHRGVTEEAECEVRQYLEQQPVYTCRRLIDLSLLCIYMPAIDRSLSLFAADDLQRDARH